MLSSPSTQGGTPLSHARPQWYYLDRVGNEFGPFCTAKMQAWFTHGCFPIGDMLLVSMSGWDRYVGVRDLFQDCQPFADLSLALRVCSGTAGDDFIGRRHDGPGQGNTYRLDNARELNFTLERLSANELAAVRNPHVGVWEPCGDTVVAVVQSKMRGRLLFTTLHDDLLCPHTMTMLASGNDAFEAVDGCEATRWDAEDCNAQLDVRAQSELRHLPWRMSAFINVLHGKTFMLDKELSDAIDKQKAGIHYPYRLYMGKQLRGSCLPLGAALVFDSGGETDE